MDYTRRDLLALMGTAGALGRYGDAAAQDAAATAALPLAAVVERNDAAVRAALQSQIADPASPNRGSVPDQFGLHSAGSASGVVETLAASFVHPRSAFHRSAVLLERIRIAAGFLERAQSPQGNIDLLTTNFNSPPDTGFVVHNVATAAAIGRLHGAEDIVTVLRPFLVRAGAGMAEGGVHTPNHRWVICSALAQINELFPDARYVRRIDEWLAEGIDIDRDGQFTERSTLTYNVVTDRALLVMAVKLKRPELLEPVRQNLRSLLYLLHADGEVVTEISRRQDQFTRGGTNGYWFPLTYLAVTDKNAEFATLAQRSEGGARLSTLLEYPQLSQPLPAGSATAHRLRTVLPGGRHRAHPPGTTQRHARDGRFQPNPVVPLWRRRHRGRYASRRHSSARASSSPTLRRSATPHMYFRQALEAPYYQPLSQKVTPETWGPTRASAARARCAVSSSPPRSPNGQTDSPSAFARTGTAGVPLAVEIAFVRVDASRAVVRFARRQAATSFLPAPRPSVQVPTRSDSVQATRPTNTCGSVAPSRSFPETASTSPGSRRSIERWSSSACSAAGSTGRSAA